MKIYVSLILNNFKSPWPCKGTSEFDLKIGVCFVENGSLLSEMGVRKSEFVLNFVPGCVVSSASLG